MPEATPRSQEAFEAFLESYREEFPEDVHLNVRLATVAFRAGTLYGMTRAEEALRTVLSAVADGPRDAAGSAQRGCEHPSWTKVVNGAGAWHRFCPACGFSETMTAEEIRREEIELGLADDADG